MPIRFTRSFGAWLLLALCAGLPSVAGSAQSAKAAAPPKRAAVAASAPLPNGDKLLAQIRKVFRSHRPPPAFITYTLTRAQSTEQGYPDYSETYTDHLWVRSSDRAGLRRRVFRDDYRGPLQFERPAFNEARDPGPPTADVFEPAPLHPHPVEFVPTPEPVGTPLPEIGSVQAIGETQYRVTKVALEGTQYHLSVVPLRDPDRNRLREIYVDAKSLEMQKFVATDKLFVDGGPTYAAIFTTTMRMFQGRPVVTAIHGQVEESYVGNGEQVDYEFKDITFPASLPAWYFDPHTYASHQSDAPE